ncbi:ASCH domain-containing protein [Aureimonas fodinaquatilis]|uniref:ASCH domain-containing protein n=1 Tax=Aureimonas fodinaquatilis TaxID=2565783 RepID=A0A5B0DU80_9HYPH|nr:ASCH domain-containing protein [Aureimonas fodinaquatilis]
MASGKKTLEIRRWRPDLAATEDLPIVENGRFLTQDGDEDRNGAAVAIVKVKTVRPFVLSDMEAACASYFEDGWFAWELVDVRPVHAARHIVAARGIYAVEFAP